MFDSFMYATPGTKAGIIFFIIVAFGWMIGNGKNKGGGGGNSNSKPPTSNPPQGK
ncbi:hypothetical protein [Paraclostridium bifermentans]|uniref:hypothetical protein n=1 Tax=Paraclostridium bifermentans TaxID=1490 RepID=UPI00374EEAA2